MADNFRIEFGRQRTHPLFQRLALKGEGQIGACAWAALAMPHAIKRLLATPITRPRLPARIGLAEECVGDVVKRQIRHKGQRANNPCAHP
jgi:hypothetical protein